MEVANQYLAGLLTLLSVLGASKVVTAIGALGEKAAYTGLDKKIDEGVDVKQCGSPRRLQSLRDTEVLMMSSESAAAVLHVLLAWDRRASARWRVMSSLVLMISAFTWAADMYVITLGSTKIVKSQGGFSADTLNLYDTHQLVRGDDVTANRFSITAVEGEFKRVGYKVQSRVIATPLSTLGADMTLLIGIQEKDVIFLLSDGETVASVASQVLRVGLEEEKHIDLRAVDPSADELIQVYTTHLFGSNCNHTNDGLVPAENGVVARVKYNCEGTSEAPALITAMLGFFQQHVLLPSKDFIDTGGSTDSIGKLMYSVPIELPEVVDTISTIKILTGWELYLMIALSGTWILLNGAEYLAVIVRKRSSILAILNCIRELSNPCDGCNDMCVGHNLIAESASGNGNVNHVGYIRLSGEPISEKAWKGRSGVIGQSDVEERVYQETKAV